MRNGSSFLTFQNTVSSNVIGYILEFRTHQSKYCLCFNKYLFKKKKLLRKKVMQIYDKWKK